jgi:putative CocE/NonD family hydrolase
MDHGSAHAVITKFNTLSNPQHSVIGAWNHGGWGHASPYDPSTIPQPEEWMQWQETLKFLDAYLLEDGTGVTSKVLYYYTMGAEEWRATETWPVQGMTPERWYFRSDSILSPAAPTAPNGHDTYAIDFTATTGETTRWHTALDGPALYADRRAEDRKLLTYTSEPLSEDLEITGYPIVTLLISSTHTDGAFFVYLEDVDENGRVTYVTEGQLRALHRGVSDATPPYQMSIPYHSFEESDGELMTPGEITEITFGLHPTSVIIRAGHRIRVAIAGHDAALFARIPDMGDAVINVERNAIHSSMIELPIVRSARNAGAIP